MTAITVTEMSREDLPVNVLSGTGKRRARIYLRCTTATANETCDLTSYVPNIADIEGICYATDDGAVAASAWTWSTTTLTAGTAGVEEICLMVTLT